MTVKLATRTVAVLVVMASSCALIPGKSGVATADALPASCSAGPVTAVAGSGFTATESLCRYFADKAQVIDGPRTFSVSVSNTENLRNGQVIDVSWTGAHPTGGIISDEQSAIARLQEYPVVLMECRGTDAPGAPLSPDTCFTATPQERTATTSANPLWTLDGLNTTALGNDVNTPATEPNGCGSPGLDQYWVPFVGADGTYYPVGPNDCSGSMPAEMTNVLDSQQDLSLAPSDTTYAETALDGSGSAKFTVETNETNASLGCSQTVACSLVVIPIEGISCTHDTVVPKAQSWTSCESAGYWPPGALADGTGTSSTDNTPSVTGTYWWSSSNWSRRISVPLSFGVPADACSGVSALAPVDIYGSELMVQAAQQWHPYLCINSKTFDPNLVQTSEPGARNLLQQGSVEAAIQAEPAAVPQGQKSFYSTPTVQAPLAVTGFAVAFVIDNGNGRPYTNLELDARLLAKLMTESYPGTNNVQSGYYESGSPLFSNPLTIFRDPEFLALNPGFTLPGRPSVPISGPAATLFSILSESDVISAVTSYINSDPEARAWLDGRPDPWGMVVNPAYKGIALPVSQWPLLDTSAKGPDYDPTINPCLAPLTPKSALVPDRPLLDAPQATLAQVAYNLQNSVAASKFCYTNPNSSILKPSGPEQLGARFLIGLVSLPAAEQADLDTAALQTNTVAASTAKFTTPAGRTFAAPNTASLEAAAALLQPDSSVGSWSFPYTRLGSTEASENAYPGTMMLSLDVPTTGLAATDASYLGQYLSFASSTGQTPGAAVGQLPAGYLPLTSPALTDELAYTKAAAVDVAKQNGDVPPLVPPSMPLKGQGGPAPSGVSNGASADHPSSSGSSSEIPTNPGYGQGGGYAAGSLGPSTLGTDQLQGNGANSGPVGGGSETAAQNSVPPTTKAPVRASIQPIQVASAEAPDYGTDTGLGGLALPLAVFIAACGAAAAYLRRLRLHRGAAR